MVSQKKIQVLHSPYLFLLSLISLSYFLSFCRHFNHLYRSLKDRYPQIGQYKFPNKSVFHTFSQFTKERRRSGFEEFLNLVMSLRPIPPEMEDFLEVDDHQTSDTAPAPPQTLSESSLRNRKHPSSQEKRKDGPISPRNAPSVGQTSNINNSNSMLTTAAVVSGHEEKNREKLKKKMFFVVMSSYIASTLCYAFLIYTSIVDITATTTGTPGRNLII
jgi:hypothetical protein